MKKSAQIAAPAVEEKPFMPVCGRSPNVRILGDIMTPLDWPDPVEKWNRVNGIKPKRTRKKIK